MKLGLKKRGARIQVNNRGQLTLFIILTVFIIVAIGLLFYYVQPRISQTSVDIPKIDKCISDSLSNKINLLSYNAGLSDPKFKYSYFGENYTFLCYTDEYFLPCVNQMPMPISVFENSLQESLLEDFQKCYDSSVEDLIKRGYEVSKGKASFNVSILPTEIRIDVDAPISASLEGSSVSSRKYSYAHKSNIYDVLSVVISLVQFETYYGDSDQLDHMRAFPNIKIKKTRIGNGVKVYTITEKNEKINYLFAIKSRPFPPGGLS